jgi:two-component system NtrC family sensor kinase
MPRSFRELKLAIVLIVIWSVAATFFVADRLWLTVPMFLLLGGAGVYTGLVYWQRRKGYHGAKILGTGFFLWGLNLIAFPFLEMSLMGLTLSYIGSALLAVMIAIGMVVEEQVMTAEEGFRAVFDSAKDAVFLVDLWKLRIVDANRTAQLLTKRSLVELVGCWFPDLCPSLRDTCTNNDVDRLKLCSAVFRPFNEFAILRANGEQILCEGEVLLVQWRRQHVLQITVRDVSERKKIGQQLRQAEKLSALGLLVAGVANRLNNPLSVIMAHAQLLESRKSTDDKMQQELLRIRKEAEQVANTIRDLLAFAQAGNPQKKACNVNELIERVLGMREADLRMANVRLVKSLDPSLPQTMLDPSQFEQVLINLLSNAMEAMLGSPQERVLSVATRDNGSAISIAISDTGRGIAENNLDRIFDPFFTTKPYGKAVGLGLSVSNSIVQEHGGRILVQSQLGQRSTFTIELPILPCAVETHAPAPATEPVAVPPGTGHRLLVVDDEPGIVEVLTEIFTAEGYTVDSALGGIDGMKRLMAGPHDIVILDLNMPDLDGRSFYGKVQATKREMAQRIVFVTGDTVSPDLRAFLTSTGNQWVAKPFSIKGITEVVNGVVLREDETARGNQR